MSASPALKLIYFDLPGRASGIRKVLSMGSVPFIDDRVARDLTPLLPILPYGKVPVLEVDGVVVAETAAIMRYAARLAGMFPPPSEPLAAALIDEVIDSFDDLFERVMAPSFWEQDAAKKKHMREQLLAGPLPQAFARLEKRLAQIATFPFFQQNATTVYLHDVLVWDFVEFMRSGKVDHIPTSFLDTYKTMITMHTKVEGAPIGGQQKAVSPAQSTTLTKPEKLQLTYFDMPGRAEQIRLALHIGGIAFDDERLAFEDMRKRKDEFPNGHVPVLRVNDSVVLAQSVAILRYVGTLTELYPIEEPIHAMQIDEVLSHLGEFYFALDPSFAESDPEKKKAMREKLMADTIPTFLDGLNKRLGQWKNATKKPSAFVMNGTEPTIADLGIYSLVMFLRSGMLDHVPTSIIDKYDVIVKACEAVQQHPRVLDWYAQHPWPAV